MGLCLLLPLSCTVFVVVVVIIIIIVVDALTHAEGVQTCSLTVFIYSLFIFCLHHYAG